MVTTNHRCSVGAPGYPETHTLIAWTRTPELHRTFPHPRVDGDHDFLRRKFSEPRRARLVPTLGLSADTPLAAWPRQGRCVILDLEYTAWEGSATRQWREEWEWREIVQIGCVIVDGGNGFVILDEFERLVAPHKNPLLSEYFIRLTGIFQTDVDAQAVPPGEAITALGEFCESAVMIVFNGHDGEVLRENCIMHDVREPWPAVKMRDSRGVRRLAARWDHLKCRYGIPTTNTCACFTRGVQTRPVASQPPSTTMSCPVT